MIEEKDDCPLPDEEIAKFTRAFIIQQKPLDNDFARIFAENSWNLFEED